MIDIEGFKKELNARMTSFIDGEHSRAPSDIGQRAATLGKFRTQLKSTISRLVDERKLIFMHDVELNNFMSQLNEPIEELMDKYITG
jgi:hypothetical protein